MVIEKKPKTTGLSISQELPFGSRRRTGMHDVLAPRHFRKLGRRLMSDVSDAELAAFYFGEKDYSKRAKENERNIAKLESKIAKAKQVSDSFKDTNEEAKKEAAFDTLNHLLDLLQHEKELLISLRDKIYKFRNA